VSFGLQVFNDGGGLILDISDRLTRYVTTHTLSAPSGTNSGWIAVSGMADDGTWYVYCGVSSPLGGGPPDVYITIGSGGYTWTRYGAIGTLTTVITVMRF
jgi:hypothetical protein